MNAVTKKDPQPMASMLLGVVPEDHFADPAEIERLLRTAYNLHTAVNEEAMSNALHKLRKAGALEYREKKNGSRVTHLFRRVERAAEPVRLEVVHPAPERDEVQKVRGRYQSSMERAIEALADVDGAGRELIDMLRRAVPSEIDVAQMSALVQENRRLQGRVTELTEKVAGLQRELDEWKSVEVGLKRLLSK
jgi:hypothetical protein